MKVVTVTGLQWTKKGAYPVTYRNPAVSEGLACVIDGRFAMVLCALDRNRNFCGVRVIIFDNDDGTMMICSNYGFAGGTNLTNAYYYVNINSIHQAGRQFTFTYGSTYRFTLPGYVKGATFNFPLTKFSVPAPPCGQGDYQATYYFPERGLTVYKYITAFTDQTKHWVSVYNDSNVYVGGGYLGLWPNAVDPFNKFAAGSLPPSVPNVLPCFKSNGLYSFGNWNDVAYNVSAYGWATQKLVGDPSLLRCDGSYTDFYRTASQQFTQYFSAAGIPNPGIYADLSIGQGVTDKTGYIHIPEAEGKYSVMAGANYYVKYNRPSGIGTDNYAKGALLTESKKAFYIGPDRFLYMADFDFNGGGYTPPPVASEVSHKGLVNWHRPVSIKGDYLA